MLRFQDGSTHRWIALDRDHVLLATLHDATSALHSLFLCEQEGTASSLRRLAETIAKKGLLQAFCTDHGGHYFYASFLRVKSGGKVDKTKPTQVGAQP